MNSLHIHSMNSLHEHNLKDLPEEAFLHWIENSIRGKNNILGEGYHGSAYLYDQDGFKIVIKTTINSGLFGWFRHLQLRNEYHVYLKLAGIEGVPKCYGFLQNKYLLLEYIDGESLRTAELEDRPYFIEKYFSLIQKIHQRGIAHGDMKRKENLLVVNAKEPCVIDFGVAVIKRKGFHPVNYFFYNLAKKIDFNAWIKHKYRGDYENIAEHDKQYFNTTVTEKASRILKRVFYPIIKRLRS